MKLILSKPIVLSQDKSDVPETQENFEGLDDVLRVGLEVHDDKWRKNIYEIQDDSYGLGQLSLFISMTLSVKKGHALDFVAMLKRYHKDIESKYDRKDF
ncbi:hypothetical protein F8M41_000501 [Gigaspora margarita]|uniref:Uncharacterized protein n=1 Tax=Gigaspora margarita TaxID=4874 RepID=A0A8H3XG33_GIGMA|nr:hypothetical protein F8M41_000501 [Gigaspora margarita]